MKPLDRHLCGHFVLPAAVGWPVGVKVLRDSESGATGVSEAIVNRLRQQWPGKGITRPYTGGVKAQVTDGRVVDLEQQTRPLQLTLLSREGDMRITLAFVVLPGHSDVFTLGIQTLKECLGIDVGKQVKEKIEERKGAGTTKARPTIAVGDVEEQARGRGFCTARFRSKC